MAPPAEPVLPLPDRFTVYRRIGFLTQELRIARRALALVEAAAKNNPARSRTPAIGGDVNAPPRPGGTPMTAATSTPAPAAKPKRRLPPALLGREDAAAFLTISASSLDRLNAAAELPAPLKIGGRVAWGRAELSVWVRHGSPDRATWARLWPQLRDRRPARK